MTPHERRVELLASVTQRDHVRGSLDAPVILVEYGDYECPDCGRAYWIIKDLLEELGDQVAFVFRNFPLTEIHPRAQMVSEALEAAGAQGRFWEMHDYFYERQHQLEISDLGVHAKAIGLNVDLWQKHLRERTYRDRIVEDLETGREGGVVATPTFYINGMQYWGASDFDSMLAAIRHEVSTTGQLIAEGKV